MEESEVLDTNLLIEGKRGLTTVLNVIEHPPAINHCQVLWPDRDDYERALDLAWKLRLQGTPVGCTDILVSSICLNRNLTLITKDNDFKYVKGVEKEFKVRVLE